MEMYNTSDYLRVTRIYKVRAVEATTMYVNPDKKEERRRDARRYPSSSPKKEKKFMGESIEYVDVHRRELEAAGPKKAVAEEEESLPFMLWVHMAAKRESVHFV